MYRLPNVILYSLYSTATQNSGVGGWRWAITPVARILRWDTNMLVSEKNAKNKICICPDAKQNKFASLPTQNPNTSQWNIGCVGSLALGLCVGHVHFIFFVLISFASDTRQKPVFQWNMVLWCHVLYHSKGIDVFGQCRLCIISCGSLGSATESA